MRKRVLINGSMITKNPTGVGTQNIQLINKLIPLLSENNFEISVYCYDNTHLLEFESVAEIKIITISFFANKLLSKFISIHRIIWNLLYLKNIAKKYDLTYSPSSYGFIGKSKQIITIHDLIALKVNKQYKNQQLYFKYLLPKILYSSSKVICISNFSANEVIGFYSKIEINNVIVIPNGIDHTKDYSTDDSDKFVELLIHNRPFCLSIGASYFNKNIITVLDVAKKLSKENILFIIVGRVSKLYFQLKNKALKLKLTNVIFLDYVDKATLSSLYKKASLNIYISLYEGFGFPPAEAAFYGTKSIISNQEALIEIYGKYFKVVNPTNVPEISKSIMDQLNSRNEKKELIYKVLETEYNWKKSAEKVLKLIEDVLQE